LPRSDDGVVWEVVDFPAVGAGGDDGHEGIAVDVFIAGHFGEDETLDATLGHVGFDFREDGGEDGLVEALGFLEQGDLGGGFDLPDVLDDRGGFELMGVKFFLPCEEGVVSGGLIDADLERGSGESFGDLFARIGRDGEFDLRVKDGGLSLGPWEGSESGDEEEFPGGDEEGSGLSTESGRVADVGGVAGDYGIEFEFPHSKADAGEAIRHFLPGEIEGVVWRGRHDAKNVLPVRKTKGDKSTGYGIGASYCRKYRMKRFAAILTLWAGVSLGQIPGEPEKTVAALEILDDWHAKDARKEVRTLHFVLWTPKGRAAPEDYEARLSRIMKNIQGFYGREMTRLGFGPRSINLPRDGDLVRIHLIEGLKAESAYGMSSGNEIKKECLPVLAEKGIDGSKETLVIFCNLAKWDAEKLIFTHKSPYYAGGNHQGGTAWQLDSPELDTKNLPLKKPMMRDGQYGRISLGQHNSIFIGGIAHELGHALGLPHCRQRPDEAVLGTALMGSGNRTYGDELRGDRKGSFLTLAHALRLASHPQFSGSTKGMNLPVRAAIDDLKMTVKGKAIHVSGKLTADPPAYAVVAYFDPDGGGDYNATTTTAVPDADGRFTLSTDALVSGKSGELRLIPLHVNGATGGWMSQTKFRYPYQVGPDGVPDLSSFQMRSDLVPFVAALKKRDREQARSIVRQLPEGKAKTIAENVLARGRSAQKTPGDGGGKSPAPLTSFKSSAAKVGWGRPAYDFIPESPFLLEAGGEIFERGIYAHAPAKHTYELGGGWQSLAGKAGMASGKGGSVRFEIKGDGKTLWESKVITSGGLVEYEVNVSEVKLLELVVDPTADGTGSDWGLWLDPILK